jgi:hypothetical protein
VNIHNVTSSRKTVTGCALRDPQSHQHRFGSFTLASHGTADIHTGSGTNGPHTLFRGAGAYLWTNTGDRGSLRNGNGAIVDRCSYSSAADPRATC